MLSQATETSHRVTAAILEMLQQRCNFLKQICFTGFHISLHINVSVLTWVIIEQRGTDGKGAQDGGELMGLI